MQANRTLYIRNITEDITESLLYELFLQAGPIETVAIKGNIAFVTFEDEESVPYSCSLFEGIKLFGSELVIRPRAGSKYEKFNIRSVPPFKQEDRPAVRMHMSYSTPVLSDGLRPSMISTPYRCSPNFPEETREFFRSEMPSSVDQRAHPSYIPPSPPFLRPWNHSPGIFAPQPASILGSPLGMMSSYYHSFDRSPFNPSLSSTDLSYYSDGSRDRSPFDRGHRSHANYHNKHSRQLSDRYDRRHREPY